MMTVNPQLNVIPEIPFEIFSLSEGHPDLTYSMRCQELWNECWDELRAEEFVRRSHHNASTYDQGCRGPLCRKALREHPRRKSPTAVPLYVREDRIYDPVLEYFHTVIKYRIRNYQLQVLEELG